MKKWIAVFGVMISAGLLVAETRINQTSETITRTSVDNTFRKELRVEVWDVQQKTEWARQTYRWKEVDCDYNPGDNVPGWHGFFSLPLWDKPQALVDSVKGIDSLSLASQIVNSSRGFLETRPVNWNAFKKEIRRIEEELPANGLAYDVLILNGRENRINLGYEYNGGGSNLVGRQKAASDDDYNQPKKKDTDYNSPKPKRDDDYNNPAPKPPNDSVVCREYEKEDTIWVPVTRNDSHLIDVRTKRVTILFENSVLLSGESESFTLTWDGRSEQIGINKSGALNQYQLSIDAQGEVYTLKGVGRVPARPNSRDFTVSSSASSGKIYLSISDSLGDELKRLSPNYGLQVRFTLYQKGSTCGSDKLIGSKSVQLTSGSGQIDVTAELEQVLGQGSYQVREITIQRLNTPYFSNDPSGALGTQWIKF